MKKWLLCVLFACTANSFAAPLSFDWKQHKAEVTETANGMENVYQIELKKEDSEHFLLNYGSREITKINGQKPSAELKKMLSTLLPPNPDLLIHRSGKAVDIPNWENFYSLITTISSASSEQKISKEKMAELNSPEIQAAMKQKTMEIPWGYWSWIWVDIDPDALPEPSKEEVSVLGIPFIQMASYELVSQDASNVTLRYTSLIQPNPAKPVKSKLFTKNDKAAWEKMAFEQVMKKVVVKATLEKRTMQPKHIEATEISPKKEVHRTYHFKWLSK